MRITNPTELREAVNGILDDTPRAAAVKSYFDFALRMAETHFRHSKSRFRLRSEIGINRTSDLALDSISDLFERDEQGVFVRLRSYYVAADHLSITDLELWSATRRLLSSAVGDAVFRHYRAADPSLAKIIRNVKRGVAFRKNLELVKRMGSTFIALTESSARGGVPIPSENVSALLMPFFRERQNITHALAALETVLQDDIRWQPAVRLSEFALAIRSCCVALHEAEAENSETTPSLFEKEEIDRLIEETLKQSIAPKRSFYVKNGKLSGEVFDGIVESIEIRLRSSICSCEAEGETNFGAFKMVFPEVSHESYRSDYRNVFEYFHRLALNSLVDRAREWSF